MSTGAIIPTEALDPLSASPIVAELRAMINAPTPFAPNLPEKHRLPGSYVAIDCEMVGVGPMGSESSLARVSVINYHGAVLCDIFVRQKEQVTDWRTKWSGIRERDMVNAKTFEEVQATVAAILKDRVLVGHAIQNDLRALLLSHPWGELRDTQVLSHKHGQSKTKRPALRNLVKDMLGVVIQQGEHSSVIDARATMAVYRLYRKEWDRPYAIKPIRVPSVESIAPAHGEVHGQKRKRVTPNDSSLPPDDTVEPVDDASPGTGLQLHLTSSRTFHTERTVQVSASAQDGGHKGISSGMSTVVTRRTKSGTKAVQIGRKGGAKKDGGETNKGWWKSI
ncbi:hypothetical protein EWM64_g5267 [Hericium alpestre]|uniref:RNA exonuclease 4 n=1 Tax=Hericium alpestre TaxID=135208 RepID=A0A4Y9ZW08_9AGAM|nr:hypothetical protein EWM64_g5267 [Hericium alpestre]